MGTTRVIVLDKGDNTLSNALPVINQEFLGRQNDIELKDIDIPEGIEIMTYIEAI